MICFSTSVPTNNFIFIIPQTELIYNPFQELFSIIVLKISGSLISLIESVGEEGI